MFSRRVEVSKVFELWAMRVSTRVASQVMLRLVLTAGPRTGLCSWMRVQVLGWVPCPHLYTADLARRTMYTRQARRNDELEDHCEGGINDDRDLQRK